MLEKEYEFFQEQLDDLAKEHKNEYVVIKDTRILGFYTNEIEAISETSKTEEIGTFIVQSCNPEDQVIDFYTNRVTFV